VSAQRRHRTAQPRTAGAGQDPKRPACATCGKSADSEFTLEVHSLVVDRDAGVRSSPYWTTSYRTPKVKISMLLCDPCVSKNVNVTTAVQVEVAQGEGNQT